MIKACSSINNDQHIIKSQYELIKRNYLRDKYVIAASCFQLATQICVCYLMSRTLNKEHEEDLESLLYRIIFDTYFKRAANSIS